MKVFHVVEYSPYILIEFNHYFNHRTTPKFKMYVYIVLKYLCYKKYINIRGLN